MVACNAATNYASKYYEERAEAQRRREAAGVDWQTGQQVRITKEGRQKGKFGVVSQPFYHYR